MTMEDTEEQVRQKLEEIGFEVKGRLDEYVKEAAEKGYDTCCFRASEVHVEYTMSRATGPEYHIYMGVDSLLLSSNDLLAIAQIMDSLDGDYERLKPYFLLVTDGPLIVLRQPFEGSSEDAEGEEQ